jgi:ABC-type antimicrobial peptide transport system ATPase subunit
MNFDVVLFNKILATVVLSCTRYLEGRKWREFEFRKRQIIQILQVLIIWSQYQHIKSW